jgi:hypothetical protein
VSLRHTPEESNATNFCLVYPAAVKPVVPSGEAGWAEIRPTRANFRESGLGTARREGSVMRTVRNCNEGRSWRNMLDRCDNPRTPHWKNYGGASVPVRVCARLRIFEGFLAELGKCPLIQTYGRCTLSRYLDSGNYSCGNCDECHANGWLRNVEWAEEAQQQAEARGKRARMLFRAWKWMVEPMVLDY